MIDAIRLWTDVSAQPAQVASTGAAWMPRVLRLVFLRRSDAKELGYAYYRLMRALHTGTTLPPLEGESGSHTSLDALRRNFLFLVGKYAPEVPGGLQIAASEVPGRTEDFSDVEAPQEGDNLDVIIEELDELIKELDRIERDSVREANINLEALGWKNLERKLADLNDQLSAAEVDSQREAIRRQVARRQAAAVERLVQDGGRSTVFAAQRADPKCLGWVRVSRTGTPCDFCAMLIGAGAVLKNGEVTGLKLYTSERSATSANDMGDLYHDNCHCYAEPVFSMEQFMQDPRFDLNREYARLWPQVTKGLSGKAAQAAWRRHFRANPH